MLKHNHLKMQSRRSQLLFILYVFWIIFADCCVVYTLHASKKPFGNQSVWLTLWCLFPWISYSLPCSETALTHTLLQNHWCSCWKHKRHHRKCFRRFSLQKKKKVSATWMFKDKQNFPGVGIWPNVGYFLKGIVQIIWCRAVWGT